MSIISSKSEESITHLHFPTITLNKDPLNNIVQMITDGYVVVFCSKFLDESLVFHNQTPIDLSKRKVIYLDFHRDPRHFIVAIRAIEKINELPSSDPQKNVILLSEVPHYCFFKNF
jgi:hypothetical protein